jgi:hypothetical protein
MAGSENRTIAIVVVGLEALFFALGPKYVLAQNLPPPEDTRHSMLREAMLGLLTGQPSITEIEARQHCLTLPADAPNDRPAKPTWRSSHQHALRGRP